MAQARRGRQARRRVLEPLLLPHRPVREPAAGLSAGHRVFAGDGSGHDPGRSRGRAGPARAQLHFRRSATHRRPSHHLPPDLRPGRAREQPHRLLHVEALHGRVRVGLPPQHQLLARRRGGGQAARPRGGRAARHGAEFHLPVGRREHLHARHRRPAAAGQGRAAGGRRHRHPSRGADRDRLLHGQLLPAPVGHRLLGPGLRRLGLPEPHHGPAHLGAGALRVPGRRLDGQPAPDGRRHRQGGRRRHSARPRPGSARGPQHLSGDGGRQAGQAAADDPRRRPRCPQERRP